MKHACTLCGSRDWPTTDTSCSLCYGEPEVDKERYDEDDLTWADLKDEA